MVGIGRVHGAQRVPLHAVPTQHLPGAQHPIERRLAALVDPEGVVHPTGPVDRQPDQEVVLGQERTPLVVQQRSVGLDRVQDTLPRTGELLGQLHAAGEELQPLQGRLPALIRHRHLSIRRMGSEQLPQVRLVHLRCHPEPAVRVQLLLGQEEAVLTIQVAHRPRRLGHHMEHPGRGSSAHGHTLPYPGSGNACADGLSHRDHDTSTG